MLHLVDQDKRIQAFLIEILVATKTNPVEEFNRLLYLFRGHNISPPRAAATVGSCSTPWAPFS
jgi:hypothetical protein